MPGDVGRALCPINETLKPHVNHIGLNSDKWADLNIDFMKGGSMEKEFTVMGKGEGVVITEYHGSGGEIEIPEMIDGKPVVGIHEGAFYACTSLRSVTIPATANLIGDGAFSYCSSLTLVTVQGNVTRIGHFAFAFCTSLSSIAFMAELPPLVGENWILGTPAEARGHAYATSHFPDPGGFFFNLKMGDPIPPIVEPRVKRAITLPPESPNQVPAKKTIVVKRVLTHQERAPQTVPRQGRDDGTPNAKTQKTRCPWCGAETYGPENCDFCGGKR